MEAIDKVNGLLSFKMADLVNKAVKAGRYSEVFEKEDPNDDETHQAERVWLPQLTLNYDKLRSLEKSKRKARKYSSTFSPLMKFLRILEK